MSGVWFPCPKSPRGSLADVIRDAGHEPLPAAESEPAPHFEGPIFFCGKLADSLKCRCGHDADMLCDFPVGGGKTCDLPLCYCCRTEVGEDYGFCPVHAAAWAASRKPVIRQGQLFKPRPVA